MIGVTECSVFYSSFHDSKTDILKKYEPKKKNYIIKVNRNSLFFITRRISLGWFLKIMENIYSTYYIDFELSNL